MTAPIAECVEQPLYTLNSSIGAMTELQHINTVDQPRPAKAELICPLYIVVVKKKMYVPY